ncbi:MAG: hypothetical protein IJX88_04745 [Clostridia bacterium]|nr:hypothetical protein [Clostridia bacterium]
MRKITKNLFVYEAKKLLFLPLCVFALSVVAALLWFVGIWHNDVKAHIGLDKDAASFLYVFYGALFASFVYRTFTMRKLYEKVRVKPEKLFLAQFTLIFVVCVLYVLVAVLLGTARVAVLQKHDRQAYLQSDYVFLFAFQGKRWWYFLFAFSVATTAGITYSFTVLIANIVYAKQRWFWKIAWGLVPLIAVFFSHELPTWVLDAFTIGNGDFFGAPMPVGHISQSRYLAFWKDLDIMIDYAQASFPLCHVCWNIYNLPMLLCAVGMMALGFFSCTFFTGNYNEGYLYKKENRKRGGTQ